MMFPSVHHKILSTLFVLFIGFWSLCQTEAPNKRNKIDFTAIVLPLDGLHQFYQLGWSRKISDKTSLRCNVGYVYKLEGSIGVEYYRYMVSAGFEFEPFDLSDWYVRPSIYITHIGWFHNNVVYSFSGFGGSGGLGVGYKFKSIELGCYSQISIAYGTEKTSTNNSNVINSQGLDYGLNISYSF